MIIVIVSDEDMLSICMFKVNYGKTRVVCEICSKLTIKTPGRYQWCRSGAFTVNFEHISQIILFLHLNK